MDDVLNKGINKFTSSYANLYDKLVTKNLDKADFDKTYTGFVSEKIERDDGSYRWRIQTNGTAYDIKPEMCNITSVGQKVRLYIPSHNYKDKYAEVIDETKYSHPDTMYINKEDDSITETYHMLDGTVENKTYKLTKKNKGLYNEEVTAITLPNGQTIKLSGFYTRK